MDKSFYVDPVGLSRGLALWCKSDAIVHSDVVSSNYLMTTIIHLELGGSISVSWSYSSPGIF